ncbi:uncharacterized protein LOC134802761 [Cydia splendana]|uniref:uncharacterized protein LOC134802761 n=1 Tax=Cydia splendana TaxID=1100963 RepID=UPI0028F4BE37
MASLFVFVPLFVCFGVVYSQILCEDGYCRTYGFDVGCTAAAQHCSINNATHSGIWLLSPTTCNCCDYCLPFIVEGDHCSLGGPGTGTTVGRCGDGLTCVAEQDGNFCRRMESDCHTAQDEYDARYESGQIGSLEQRPACDGKGRYQHFHCVPTQTCFCQSDEGERLFGEVLHQGAVTERNMHCGCSRLHDQIKKSISPGVKLPVIGLRCTSDGNFNPVQCLNNDCYCVDEITGAIKGDEKVNLETEPISELSCYDESLDLFPSNTGTPPYNYTSPCLEEMEERIAFLEESERDGFNVDFFSSIPECLPDATYGRVVRTFNGSKVCVDERGQPIEGYEAMPGTTEYEEMNCNCALTTLLMASVSEKPVCCSNGNFRHIQCRRGACRCVDGDGRQVGVESTDVAELSCYGGQEGWKTC